MKRKNIRLLVVAAIVASAVIGIILFKTSTSPAAGIRNVVLISIDTCRSDILSCYGFRHKTTPNIDAVAAEGTLFKNVYSPVPLTLPAHSSMLTGDIPPRHGVHDNIDYKLAESNTTLAEILKEEGFTTGALISAFVLDSQFGTDQGFDTYNDIFEEKHIADNLISERKGDEATRLAMDWLDEHADERFFYFLHYYDPHTPYEPPEPFASRFAASSYAGEIAFTDHCIGTVIKKLKSLGLYESTLIVITGDHGEMLGSHGESTHAYFIYQDAVKVPLIFRLPGSSKARVIDEPVGIVDIVPTICKLLDIETNIPFSGRDLSSFFSKRKNSLKAKDIYCESLTPTKYDASSLIGLIAGNWKYIQTSRPELYNIMNDPREEQNLYQQQLNRARMMQDRLKQILEEQVRKSDPQSKLTLDEQTRRRLESLGYVAGSSVSEDFDFDQSKDDPKDLINFHKNNYTINELIALKQYDEAEQICGEMLRQRPESFIVHLHLGKIAFETNDFTGAVTYLQKATELKPEHYEPYNYLALSLVRLGKLDQAVEYFKKGIELAPSKYEMLSNLGLTLIYQSKFDEGIDYCLKALEINPLFTDALQNAAFGFAGQNKYDEAAAYYEKALEIDNDNFSVHYGLARVLFAQNKYDAAAMHYREMIRIFPDSAGSYAGLGTVLAKQGKLSEALASYKKSLEIDPNQPVVHEMINEALREKDSHKE